MARRYIYLVRHGNYNVYEEVGDDLGGSLTALGREQAEYVAQYFEPFPFESIFTSSMRRAFQTTEIIAARHPHLRLETFRELWESVPVVPFRLAGKEHERYPELSKEQLSSKLAENKFYAEKAFEIFFQPLNGTDEEERHELIVAHGNLIRYLICRVLDVDPRAWANMSINQCSISRVRVDDLEGIALESFNETMHLPYHLWVD